MGYGWPDLGEPVLSDCDVDALAFVFAWNSFIFPLVLGGSDVQTVTVAALGYISSAQAFYNRMAAASVISSVPQIILALSIQRYLIRGMSFGAVKG